MWKDKSRMTQKIRKALDDQDWVSIIKRLTIHSHFRLKFWNLLSEKGIKGYSAQDIALEAVSLVYTGEWNWDPDKSDLLTYLKFHVVNGLISNLARNKEVLSSDNRADFDLESDFSIEEDINAKMITSLIRESLKSDEPLLTLFDGLATGMKRKELCESLHLPSNEYDNIVRRLKSRILKFEKLVVTK
jgi:hypothetical protein